jgi:hypothetical protein
VNAVDDRPAEAAPPRVRGSLLRAEAHRFRSRRFIQVLLLLAVVGWLVAVLIGLTAFGTPGEGDLADARQRIEQEVAFQAEARQQCLADPAIPDEQCPPTIRASDFRVEDFVSKEPFDLGSMGEAGAIGFGAAAAVLSFLIGATWIGAEWSARSLVALLFWVPQRLKVMGVKVAVLAVAIALVGVAAQAAWLAMAGILDAVAGSGEPVPAGFWGDLLATQGRGILLAVFAALLGYALANLTRNTGAALGIGFVYFAIVETAVRILRPGWEPGLLSNNAVGLLLPGGVTVFVPSSEVGPGGFEQQAEYLIGNLQAGIYLAAVTAVVLGVGVVLFAKRDIH